MPELVGSGTTVRIQIEIHVEAIVDLRNHAELLILVMFQLGICFWRTGKGIRVEKKGDKDFTFH